MINQLTFIKPMTNCDMYLIMFRDMIVGSVYINDNIITNIDIHSDFFNDIKNILIQRLLFELGKDTIILKCDKTFAKYYKELGFEKKCRHNDTILLRYDTQT